MNKRILAVCAVVATLMVFGGSAAFAQSGLTAMLTGAAEVGGGDTDGSGSSTVTLTSDTELSYTISVKDIILPAAAAHIHKGAAGANGPVVIGLSMAPDAAGMASGTATADAAIIADIRANPQNYYVNVHTSDFPNGAVRGQLGGTSAGAPMALPATGSSDGMTTQLVVLAMALLAIGFGLTWRLRRVRG